VGNGALVTLLIRSDPGDSEDPSPRPTGVTTTTAAEAVTAVTVVRTAIRVVIAFGDEAEVCEAVIRPPEQEGGDDKAIVLGTGPWAGSSGEEGRWLFCQGDTGSGVGAVAAHSTGDGQWTTQSLGLAQTKHAGDVINVDFGSYSAVSLTRDSLIFGGHQHVWTIDSGTTWYSIGPLGG